MDKFYSLLALSALSQSTRLDVFRLLVKHEPEGLPAGEISRVLQIPQNTMSTHLGILARAGLIDGQKAGRSIQYRAKLGGIRGMIEFILQDCCGGRAEICAPLIKSLTPCCEVDCAND
jgi:DNA-binding transcriptional ArsR family regulator